MLCKRLLFVHAQCLRPYAKQHEVLFSFVRISIISLVPSFHIFHINMKSSLSTEFHLNEFAAAVAAVYSVFLVFFFCHCFIQMPQFYTRSIVLAMKLLSESSGLCMLYLKCTAGWLECKCCEWKSAAPHVFLYRLSVLFSSIRPTK